MSCVIDGVFLLHGVKLATEITFKDVINSYEDYIQVRFGRGHNLCIVFNGYNDKLSIKATEHKPRSLQSTSQNVNITENMIRTRNFPQQPCEQKSICKAVMSDVASIFHQYFTK